MAARTFTTEIEELLVQINLSIHYLTIDAEKNGIAVYEMKNPDGSLAIERLLLAKAHAIHTVAILNDSSEKSKRQRELWLNLSEEESLMFFPPVESYRDDVRNAIRLRNEQTWGK